MDRNKVHKKLMGMGNFMFPVNVSSTSNNYLLRNNVIFKLFSLCIRILNELGSFTVVI